MLRDMADACDACTCHVPRIVHTLHGTPCWIYFGVLRDDLAVLGYETEHDTKY